MIPDFLSEAAQKVWSATLEGQGITLYPWLESLLAEAQTPEALWVPSLEIGSAIYLLHGRFAEGERLARRAVARSHQRPQSDPYYLRALLALARAYHCQGRTEDAWDLWREVRQHLVPEVEDWHQQHFSLLKGQMLRGETVPQQPSWLTENDLRALSRPNPFPLWQGQLYRCPMSPFLPLWQPVAYPTPLDHLASWPRDRGVEREPWLQKIRLWRQSSLTVRWLGSLGEARFSYTLELNLHCPERTVEWVSLEVAGSGYEVAEAPMSNSNLLLLQEGKPLELPARPGEAGWRALFRGSSGAVQRGTRAVVRVGFSEGPPLQAFVRA